MAWLGLLLGALIGAYAHGFSGLVVGAVIGTFVGAAWHRLMPRNSSIASASGGALDGAALQARLVELERRLAALEAAVGRAAVKENGEMIPVAQPSVTPEAPAAAARPAAPDVTPAAESTPLAPALHPVRKGGVGGGSPPLTEAAASSEAGTAAPTSSPRPLGHAIWAWFSDGNTMVRVGVVVLFFGVAFLLSYFAEHVTVPIELQFLAVAAVGFALIGVGIRLRHSRDAYALALMSGR